MSKVNFKTLLTLQYGQIMLLLNLQELRNAQKSCTYTCNVFCSVIFQKIIMMVPTEEEKTKIQEAQMQSPDTPLGHAEQFLVTLASINELRARLSLWAYRLDYDNNERVRITAISQFFHQSGAISCICYGIKISVQLSFYKCIR